MALRAQFPKLCQASHDFCPTHMSFSRMFGSADFFRGSQQRPGTLGILESLGVKFFSFWKLVCLFFQDRVPL